MGAEGVECWPGAGDADFPRTREPRGIGRAVAADAVGETADARRRIGENADRGLEAPGEGPASRRLGAVVDGEVFAEAAVAARRQAEIAGRAARPGRLRVAEAAGPALRALGIDRLVARPAQGARP